METRLTRFLLLGLALALPTLTGCGSRNAALTPLPTYAPVPEAVWRLERVAMIELEPGQAPPEIARFLSESIQVAVSAQGPFTLDLVPACEASRITAAPCRAPRLTLEQLAALRSAYRCDGVMVGSVRGFEAYPDGSLSVQLWLIDLRSGRAVWGVDHAWRVSEPITAEKMRRHFAGTNGDDGARLAEMSPRAFAEFVAWELARALPLPPGQARSEPRPHFAERVGDAAWDIFTN